MGIIVVKKPKRTARQRSMSNKEVSNRKGNTYTISKDPTYASRVRNQELAALNRARGKAANTAMKKTKKQQTSKR